MKRREGKTRVTPSTSARGRSG